MQCSKCKVEYTPTAAALKAGKYYCKACTRTQNDASFWRAWLQSPIAQQFATGKGKGRGQWVPPAKIFWADDAEGETCAQ